MHALKIKYLHTLRHKTETPISGFEAGWKVQIVSQPAEGHQTLFGSSSTSEIYKK